jgi:hypothetical protein
MTVRRLMNTGKIYISNTGLFLTARAILIAFQVGGRLTTKNLRNPKNPSPFRSN